MKLLLLSDKESPYLWDYYQPGRLDGYDLMISCGDLNANYLSFLVTMGRAPLLYVHGNHDAAYEQRPPEGCDCIEDQLVTVKGLRILGLGGSAQYSGGPHQYTERQMERRIRRLWFKLRRAKGVDIDCLLSLLDKYQPKYLIHGHVHATYGANRPRVLQHGPTTIINAYERYVLDL